jgi:hypothetical protein
MRTTNLTRRRGARSTALLSAAVLAASGIVATMGAANAGITIGPDRGDGLPAYIVDGQGVAVAPCDTNTAVCGGAFDPADPAYWDAGGDAGPIRLVYSVSSPAGGRIARFTGDALTPGRYTIKDPWGTVTCRAPGGDMDCRLPGRRITTLLRQTTTPPGGFVGSPNVNRTFTGSPTGFNRVLITGPGNFKASTNRLAITGMMRNNTAMSAINKRAVQLGTGRQADRVTKTIRYTSFGTAAARPAVRKGGTNPGAFSVRDNCRSVAPGRACAITVTFAPRQHANSVKRAVLTINDNGMAAPRKVRLKGVGVR